MKEKEEIFRNQGPQVFVCIPGRGLSGSVPLGLGSRELRLVQRIGGVLSIGFPFEAIQAD